MISPGIVPLLSLGIAGTPLAAAGHKESPQGDGFSQILALLPGAGPKPIAPATAEPTNPAPTLLEKSPPQVLPLSGKILPVDLPHAEQPSSSSKIRIGLSGAASNAQLQYLQHAAAVEQGTSRPFDPPALKRVPPRSTTRFAGGVQPQLTSLRSIRAGNAAPTAQILVTAPTKDDLAGSETAQTLKTPDDRVARSRLAQPAQREASLPKKLQTIANREAAPQPSEAKILATEEQSAPRIDDQDTDTAIAQSAQVSALRDPAVPQVQSLTAPLPGAEPPVAPINHAAPAVPMRTVSSPPLRKSQPQSLALRLSQKSTLLIAPRLIIAPESGSLQISRAPQPLQAASQIEQQPVAAPRLVRITVQPTQGKEPAAPPSLVTPLPLLFVADQQIAASSAAVVAASMTAPTRLKTSFEAVLIPQSERGRSPDAAVMPLDESSPPISTVRSDTAAVLVPASAAPALVTTASSVPTIEQTSARASERPADFTQIVDRLFAARDVATEGRAPQPVAVSLSHAEFGKVSLHFTADKSGLTVAMTSGDPGFAPAVQAAAPTERHGNSSDAGAFLGNGQPSPRSDASLAQSGNQSSFQGQPSARQPTIDPRDSRGGQAQSQTQTSADDPAPRRRGRFA